MLDLRICKSIESMLDKLSTTGKNTLDMKILKELFVQAGQSKEYLQFLHSRLMKQLEKEHSEIRFGTFLIIDKLFRFSNYFRNLILEDFADLLDLVIGSDPDKPLPQPREAAQKLKLLAVESIRKWNSIHGSEDKRLRVGINFLKKVAQVDFEEVEKKAVAEAAKARLQGVRALSKIAALRTEVEENVDEISRLVTEMDNCCALLLPSPENFLHAEANAGCENNATRADCADSSNSEFDLREHGLGLGPSAIHVFIQNPTGGAKIQRTEDNEELIQTMADLYSLCKNRFLPMAVKWCKTISNAEDPVLHKRVHKLKEMIQDEMKRCEELGIIGNKGGGDESDSTSDSDFEDVPDKDGFEEFASAPACPAPSAPSLSSSKSKVADCVKNEPWSLSIGDSKDPTSMIATVEDILKHRSRSSTSLDSTSTLTKQIQTKKAGNPENRMKDSSQCSSRKEKLLQIAPKLPFDIDLYHWEEADKDLKSPSVELVAGSTHRFWQPPDREGEVIESEEGISALRKRTIEFSGNFEPVKWNCRAPLESGKLCPRRDRIKCPFHGSIIPRDKSGEPTRPEDIAALKLKKAQEELSKPPDWQDPTFLKELKEKIGIDLTIRPTKKGARKKKTFAELYPGLTDLKKDKKTPKSRLTRKIFNRNSIKRVATDMDNLTYKRHRDKFGDQFNYAHGCEQL